MDLVGAGRRKYEEPLFTEYKFLVLQDEKAGEHWLHSNANVFNFTNLYTWTIVKAGKVV